MGYCGTVNRYHYQILLTMIDMNYIERDCLLLWPHMSAVKIQFIPIHVKLYMRRVDIFLLEFRSGEQECESESILLATWPGWKWEFGSSFYKGENAVRCFQLQCTGNQRTLRCRYGRSAMKTWTYHCLYRHLILLLYCSRSHCFVFFYHIHVLYDRYGRNHVLLYKFAHSQ